MEASVFPHTARYIAALPKGLASYPQCLVKGAVLRGFLETSPALLKTDGLDEELRHLIEAPPLPNEWFSEVHFNALMTSHEERLPSASYDDWVYRRNRRLLESPLYRMLFLVMSPERLFTGMPRRWGAFRRGSEMSIVEHGGGHALIEVRFPAKLHDARTLRNLCIACRAACDAAGARGTDSALTLVEPTRGRVSIRWDP